MHIYNNMRIYKCIVVCMLSVLLAACMGGIDSLGGGSGIPATTVSVVPGNAKITITWDEIAGIGGYRLYREGPIEPTALASIVLAEKGKGFQTSTEASVETVDLSGGSFVDETVSNGSGYCYELVGLSGGDEGETSNRACTIPLAPPDVTASVESGAVTIVLQSVPGASSYDIFWKSAQPIPASFSVNKAASFGDEWEFLTNILDTGASTISFRHEVENCQVYTYTALALNILNERIDEGQEAEARPRAVGELGGRFWRETADMIYNVDVMSDGTTVALAQSGGSVVTFDTISRTFGEVINLPSGAVPRAIDVVNDGAGDYAFVAGSSGVNVFVCKVDLLGQLDATFGDGGCVTGGAGIAYGITVDSLGRILISGRFSSEKSEELFAVSRYLSDGQIDPSFGVDGSFLGVDGRAFDITIMGELIVAAGYADIPCGEGSCYERYYVVLDSSGTRVGGDENIDLILGVAQAYDVLVTNGDILMLGRDGWLGEAVIWYLPDGGGESANAFEFAGADQFVPTRMILDCYGQPVIAGKISGAYTWAAAARLDTNFDLDETFGNLDAGPAGFFVDTSYGDAESHEIKAIAEIGGVLWLFGWAWDAVDFRNEPFIVLVN